MDAMMTVEGVTWEWEAGRAGGREECVTNR
jgi:hypothetical protein